MSQLPQRVMAAVAGRRRDPNAGQVRVTFHAPPDFEEVSSIWVRLEPRSGGASVTLLYDYPDFRPQPGWKIRAGGKTYEIGAADGRNLDCAEVAGGDEQ